MKSKSMKTEDHNNTNEFWVTGKTDGIQIHAGYLRCYIVTHLQQEIQYEKSKYGHTLGSAVDAWEYLVHECEKGYEDCIEEYWNDLSNRDVIEELLFTPKLEGFEELEPFRKRVLIADTNFKILAHERTLGVDNRTAWWHQIILKIAGERLAEDYLDEYIIEVTVVKRVTIIP